MFSLKQTLALAMAASCATAAPAATTPNLTHLEARDAICEFSTCPVDESKNMWDFYYVDWANTAYDQRYIRISSDTCGSCERYETSKDGYSRFKDCNRDTEIRVDTHKKRAKLVFKDNEEAKCWTIGYRKQWCIDTKKVETWWPETEVPCNW